MLPGSGAGAGLLIVFVLGAGAAERAKPPEPWPLFQPLHRPTLPPVRQTAWCRNPIDDFLAAERERHGLKPRPEAPRHVLLRRLYLDLTGLPPTRDELHAFLADRSPDAYEKVVDRLLASPRYGERWGRHWMDIWRYSDWAGFGEEIRESQRHIWHWRDWIVESLNHDKGYDRMIVEMLAADELTPNDRDSLRATGFLARNWYKFNRNVWLEQTVEHTAKAFLAVTVNCARCHDHKYDPISQKEHYAFRAFFEPYEVRTDPWPGRPDVKKDGLPRAFDAKPNAPTYVFVRGNEMHPDQKLGSIAPAVPAVLGGAKLAIEPVKASASKAAAPRVVSSGRRLALALWMADRQNPLTARVAVNHIWMRHFGKPIVPTVFDFGHNGRPPSHPQLLDWLAAEFMERGWSMKQLHRLIVTSSAYRMDSVPDAACQKIDPDNRYLWRMNPRRLEAEAVRDSLLQVAGRLDDTMGGPDLDFNLGMTSHRRSLYFRHAAEKEMEFLRVFDASSASECYRRSETIVPQQALALENSPLALALSRELARQLNAQANADLAGFVEMAFEQVLARRPTPAEQSACLRFLNEQAKRLENKTRLSAYGTAALSAVPASSDPALRSREDLIQVLMNHNDFVTIR
jgi:Protein of unknown function (DUF1553)/Protein of unknown function (DUF1549)